MIWTAKHVHVWDYQIGLPLYALLANVSQVDSIQARSVLGRLLSAFDDMIQVVFGQFCFCLAMCKRKPSFPYHFP